MTYLAFFKAFKNGKMEKSIFYGGGGAFQALKTYCVIIELYVEGINKMVIFVPVNGKKVKISSKTNICYICLYFTTGI